MTEPTESTSWWRFGRVMMALAVGAFAAYASYDHMRAVALATGQSPSIAALLPISVDGLIVFATFSMDGRNRFWPRLSFWLGVTATISANVLSARHDLLSQIVASWAPISLLCVIETWSRRNKTLRWQFRKPAEVPVVNTSVATAETGNAIGTDEAKSRTPNSRGVATAEKVTKAAARVARKNPKPTPALIAAEAGVSESTVRRVLPQVATPIPEPTPVPA